jgi:glycosyltransferase involved in cell wall biosynthesis
MKSLPPQKVTTILWTADFDAEDGQSIVTRRVYNAPSQHWRECIFRRGGGFLAVYSYCVAVFRLIYFSFNNRQAPIYAVVSRSNVGFLRDIPVLLLARFRRRVICHFHGSDVLELMSESWLCGLAKRMYQNCILVVPSQHLTGPLQTLTGAKVVLCENPVELVGGALSGNATRVRHTVPVVIWNSNRLASKGFANTLRAINEINDEVHRVDLVLLGRSLGDPIMSKGDIDALVAQFQGKQWLHDIGSVSSEEAAKQLACSDIVALPSHYSSECQPLAIIHAMCLGKSVVASATPAMRATLKDYPAFIAHEPTVQSVKCAILAAIENIGSQNDDVSSEATFRDQARLRFSSKRFDDQISALLSGKDENTHAQ